MTGMSQRKNTGVSQQEWLITTEVQTYIVRMSCQNLLPCLNRLFTTATAST